MEHASSPSSAPLLAFGVVGLDTLRTPAGEAAGALGGSAPYAALGARYFHPHVCMPGAVGDDFPREYAEGLRTSGIDLSGLETRRGATFAWEAEYEENTDRRRTIATRYGTLENWRPRLPAAMRCAGCILCTNATPALQLSMLAQCSRSAFVLADFMESWIRSNRDEVEQVIARADLVLMNEEEARAFAASRDALAAAERTLAMGPRWFVLKQGSGGATLLHQEEDGRLRIFRCPAWPLRRIVDPTGAGDSFMGALGGWAASHSPGENPDWEEMKRGTAAAAVVGAAACESFGAAALLRTPRGEIMRRLRAFADMTGWTFADGKSI